MNALTVYKWSRFFRIKGLGPISSFLDMTNYLVFGCILPSHAQIGSTTRIEHRGVAVVVNRRAVIGERCSIGAQVVIGGKGKDHQGVPTIGDDVSIGAGAKLLGPIQIGNGAMIGANSVVLINVPEGATAVGVPARILPRAK